MRKIGVEWHLRHKLLSGFVRSWQIAQRQSCSSVMLQGAMPRDILKKR
jgi:hypothetical protein